jgi:hypothetical protein
MTHLHKISLYDGLVTLEVNLSFILKQGHILYSENGFFFSIDTATVSNTGTVHCTGTTDSLRHYEIFTGIALN